MIIESLFLRNFRILSELSIQLTPGTQLFIGMNAQGKTSLIEAFLFLSTSTSHRTRREEELIKWGEKTAYLRGHLVFDDTRKKIECGLEKKRKTIKIDEIPIAKVGDLYGHFRTVLFAPEDLNIISGSPHDRRRFIDMAIAQLDPTYIPLLHQFRRALQQRNHGLKKLQKNRSVQLLSEISVWDKPFLENASLIIHRRQSLIQQLAPLINENYSQLASDGPIRLMYGSGEFKNETEIYDYLKEKIERSRNLEIERGSSQYGPHRDDLTIELAGKNISQFGSQGQRRAAALSFRLAQAQICRQITGVWPLLLIDDVIHEMDQCRRNGFWRRLDLTSQMIVTATNPEQLGEAIKPAQRFKVEHGKISAD